MTGDTPVERRRAWAAALLLVAAVAACYANSLRAPFVFDDPLPDVRLDYSSRPLVWASIALNRSISGADTWSYHAFNALVHLGCGLRSFGILRRTLERAAASLAPRTREGLALAITPSGSAIRCRPSRSRT